ncbi:MAG: hypothetical protein RR891_07695 [Clostridium sp.]|uniref:hypothetical protein n=1 Tax=Clostridium sp. TaxID=1506 RepID=UPI0030436618
MYSFKNITPTNGFDFYDLNNARQNNYAWSMAELDEYIYVGTGRNIPLLVIQSMALGVNPPSLLEPIPQDNLPEIWRYKKDGSLPWNRVYKAEENSGITGFRFMISDRPAGGSPCIFVAAFGAQVKIFKSTNGCDWFQMPYEALVGTSSRAMIVIKDKLYVATVDDANLGDTPLLYSSKDPEYYPWEDVIDSSNPDFNFDKNPKGAITNMAIFNNKLYVATSSSDGAQVWRTEGEEPRVNHWVLVVDKGFGDSANKYVLSIGVFKDYLYVSGTKPLPLSWAIPFGCDVIRINKNDDWELVVGGIPLIPSTPSKGTRGESISGLRSGFNNPFNVYAWQIQEYKGKLLISTFDDSSNMEVILDTILGNRVAIEGIIGVVATKILIEVYEAVVRILARVNYPIGFDLYASKNGRTFEPILKRGLNNPNNYGGRILFVDCENKLYLGTANPFQGCEVWDVKYKDDDCYCNSRMTEVDSYDLELIEEIEGQFKFLKENLEDVIKNLPSDNYHNFIKQCKDENYFL